VRKHRNAYTSGNRTQKQRLGQEILDEIHRKGGRFLKQVDPYFRSNTWFEVSEEVSLAKVKQALREHRNDGWWTEESNEKQDGGEVKKTGVKAKGATSLPFPSEKRCTGAPSEPTVSDSFGNTNVSGSRCPVSGTRMGVTTKNSSPDTTYIADSRMSTSPTAADNFGVVMGASVVTPSRPTVTEGGLSSSIMLSPILSPLWPPIPGEIAAGLSVPILSPLVPSLPVGNVRPGTVDPRLLLFRDLSFGVQAQAVIPQPLQMIPRVQPSSFTVFSNSWDCTGCMGHGLWQNVENTRKNTIVSSHQRQVDDNSIDTILQDFSRFRASATCAVDAKQRHGNLGSTSTVPAELLGRENERNPVRAGENKFASRATSSASIATEDDVAAFLLSSLTLVDRPVVTEEQEAMERAKLSIEEKAAILTDALGMASARGIHRNKKARTDLDRRSTAFLVRLMKAEIEKIPIHERQALVEAQMKCGISEFSDARLEQFLRCEGMNTKVCTARRQGASSACKRQKLTSFVFSYTYSWQLVAL